MLEQARLAVPSGANTTRRLASWSHIPREGRLRHAPCTHCPVGRAEGTVCIKWRLIRLVGTALAYGAIPQTPPRQHRLPHSE
jgi:hypothetical protein